LSLACVVVTFVGCLRCPPLRLVVDVPCVTAVTRREEPCGSADDFNVWSAGFPSHACLRRARSLVSGRGSYDRRRRPLVDGRTDVCRQTSVFRRAVPERRGVDRVHRVPSSSAALRVA
jgi:hypothetical protein